MIAPKRKENVICRKGKAWIRLKLASSQIIFPHSSLTWEKFILLFIQNMNNTSYIDKLNLHRYNGMQEKKSFIVHSWSSSGTCWLLLAILMGKALLHLFSGAKDDHWNWLLQNLNKRSKGNWEKKIEIK